MTTDISNNKGFGKDLNHTATFNGKQYSLTTSRWSWLLDCTVSSVSRGIKRYGSVQALIDTDYKQRQYIDTCRKRFFFSRKVI